MSMEYFCNLFFYVNQTGAKMVFIGRPAIWGLSHSGQAGLENVLNILKDELANVMTLAGTPTLDDISMDSIYQLSKI